MKIARAVAGLLLLFAFALNAEAGSKCAKCRLDEGDDPCNCGNTAVRARKLAKPELFVSPEDINNVLKLKSTYSAYTPPAYSGPAPSSVSYSLSSTSYKKNLLRPITSIAPKFEPIGDLCHSCKGYKDNVVGVIPARPPKVLCKCPKSGSEEERIKTPVTSPTYPTQVPLESYSASNNIAYNGPAPSITPAASYSVSTPLQTVAVPSPYSIPMFTYNSRKPSYNTPAEVERYLAAFYSGSAAPYAQYAPSYQVPASYSPPSGPSIPVAASALAQYVTTYHQKSCKQSESRPDSGCKDKQKATTTFPYTSAYQGSVPVMYVAAPSSPAKRSYEKSELQSDYDKNAHEAEYDSPCVKPDEPPFYVAELFPSTVKRSYKKAKPQTDYGKSTRDTQYASAYQEPTHVLYVTAPSPTTEQSYIEAQPQAAETHEAQFDPAYINQPATAIYEDVSSTAAKKSYKRSKSECGCKGRHKTTNTPATLPAQIQYAATYQEPALVNYAAVPTNPNYKQYNLESNYDKDEQEAETYVEIVLQQEQAPKYTADPTSISLAYKNLAESQGKMPVAEDSLAYGHYTEPTDGRICKHISNFDEEKLHALDKPVVEFKYGNDDSQNLKISYSDIGYGPVAPLQNRFVPKTDNASNSPYSPSNTYDPPPKGESSILGGPLGPTIPGYKSGGVIVGKSTCGKTFSAEEGKRQVVLVESEEYDDDSYNGKGGIIERIKSSACKSGY